MVKPIHSDSEPSLEQTGIAMQQLYGAVLGDVEKLRTLHGALPEMRERLRRLMQFYHNEWLGYLDEVAAHPEVEARLFRSVPQDQYSILAQDTIWDAVQECHELVNETRSVLATMFEEP